MAVLETYFSTSWRIGRGAARIIETAPALSPAAPVILRRNPARNNDWLAEVIGELLPVDPGDPVNPTIYEEPGVTAGMVRAFVGDFYYRIWAIPEVLEVQNPRLNTDIPFLIWNAYPYENDLTDIGVTNGDGLELDVEPVSEFRPIELRTINLQITPSAPIQIDAVFEFIFAEGSALFYFSANIADFVQMVPDPPVQEVWAWLTDIIAARNGAEQRIALRAAPRRSIRYSFMLEDETERRRQYNRWFKSLSTRLVLPYYQYATGLTQAVASGGSQLYFDPARTDLRDGEFALIYDTASEQGYLVKIAAVETDGATLDSPITFDATTDMIIAPAFTSRLADRTGFDMQKVTGKITVQGESLVSRAAFSRPGSEAVIPTYDGLPVMNIRPISVGDNPETFDANYEVIDGRTGVQDIFTAWLHTEVIMTRKWTIRRLQDPGEMDWWRDFLDLVRGQQNPFLIPTWFADLTPAAPPSVSTTQLVITGSDYAALYFPHQTFKRLQIETAAGLIWRTVVSAVDNGDGTTTLELNLPFGDTADDVLIGKISFLNIVRLASDTVTLQHERIRTQIELTTRTIDA